MLAMAPKMLTGSWCRADQTARAFVYVSVDMPVTNESCVGTSR